MTILNLTTNESDVLEGCLQGIIAAVNQYPNEDLPDKENTTTALESIKTKLTTLKKITMSKVKITEEEQNANNNYFHKMVFRMTPAEYNIVRQLIRIELADIIDADVSNKYIDFFTTLDASLTAQYEANQKDDGDLPF